MRPLAVDGSNISDSKLILIDKCVGNKIDKELVAVTKEGFIAHDSNGFEAGSHAEFDIVKEFLQRRDKKEDQFEKVHMVW